MGYLKNLVELLEYFQLKSASVFGYGADLRLGYNIVDNLSVYTIVSALSQSLEDSNSRGLGFGYGAGLSYQVFDNIAIGTNYKTYSMSSETAIDYDYDTFGINLQYTF